MSEIVFIRGEFHKKYFPKIPVIEYFGDKILLGDNPRTVCRTENLNLTEYLEKYFCGDGRNYKVHLNMVRVASADKLFSEKEICREEEYCWSGELYDKENILYIGDIPLYDIIWEKSPLRTTDHGFLYIELTVDDYISRINS